MEDGLLSTSLQIRNFLRATMTPEAKPVSDDLSQEMLNFKKVAKFCEKECTFRFV